MELELCTDGADGAELAARYGFKRIELCSALSEGGLTPSFGAIEVCSAFPVEVHAMIRPIAGGFEYSSRELDTMRRDIPKAADAGATGVVLGVLDREGRVAEVNEEFAELARSRNLQVTFHRAFDYAADPISAIERIIAFGFDRVLSSGQQEKALSGLELLASLQKYYGDKIQVMAGSGVGPTNALEFIDKGIRHLHCTARKQLPGRDRFSMGGRWVPDEVKMKAMAEFLY